MRTIMSQTRTLCMCALLALPIALACSVQGAIYHVDGKNDAAADDNPGTEEAPWKTVQHAADAVAPGDTVLVGPAQYDEQVKVKRSGTKDALITFRADPRRKARVKGFVLEADYVSVEGFEITDDGRKANGIFAGIGYRENARTGCRMIDNFIHDVRGVAIYAGKKALVKNNLMKNVFRGLFVNGGTLVENNEIDTLVPALQKKDGKTRAKKTQYAFFGGDDITFRGNYFHGAPEEYLKKGMGVCFFASYDAWKHPASRRILIENNRCFNATHASEPMGTVRRQSSHITYRNNLFVNTVYVGVMPKGYKHVTVENNTFINCGAYPVWLQGEQCETAVVRNNLIAYYKRGRVVEKFGWKKPDAGIRFDTQGPMPDCDYNLFFGTPNRQYGEHDFTAEPEFVDPENGDFRLKAGSPGIDAGMAIEAIETDLRGVKRPQGKGYDVGAYEFTTQDE